MSLGPWEGLKVFPGPGTTCAEFAGQALCQLSPTGQLLVEVLLHGVVQFTAAEKLLEVLHCVLDMLDEKGRDGSSEPHLLPQAGQLPSLILDQGIFPEVGKKQ